MFTQKLWRYTDVERLHRAISVPRVNYACIITGTNRLTYVMRLSLSLVTCPCKATNSSAVDFFILDAELTVTSAMDNLLLLIFGFL